MHVNGIPNYINHCTTYFFADDAKCIRIIDQPSDCTLTQADLTSFSNGATNGSYYLIAVNAALCDFPHPLTHPELYLPYQ